MDERKGDESNLLILLYEKKCVNYVNMTSIWVDDGQHNSSRERRLTPKQGENASLHQRSSEYKWHKVSNHNHGTKRKRKGFLLYVGMSEMPPWPMGTISMQNEIPWKEQR